MALMFDIILPKYTHKIKRSTVKTSFIGRWPTEVKAVMDTGTKKQKSKIND